MRRYLREAWNDILKGENLELYTTIAISLGITILNLLGIKEVESKLSAIVLALLGFIAGSLLSNRKATNNLQSSTEDLKKAINNGNLKIDQQDILYAELIKWIFQNKTPEKITFIQHSGVLLRDKILAPLMRLNTKIILYQQCDQIWDRLNLGGDTKDRISQIPRELSLRERNNRHDPNNCYNAHLYIKRFYSPASVRAVLVDSDVLIISWYVYSQDDEGKTNIKGSEYPGLMVFKETTEFDMLQRILETICKDLDQECLAQPEDYPGSQLIHIHQAIPHPPVNP
ncbi:MAG: hypothetical protein EWV91_17055 [Microcystis aeruginosa Ma_QC_Ca_00000000_S207]|uniref:Uncharacterized protein n=1 Tax=Microcystis aeruginosa Ma_QC_Ca_00000000_S207 TaxID=2486251 RepID=A0A552FBQ9_MICAE|nr:MAG: hypothetical protein EWV91_17055 [Microcystis aeruginosa Ma_QC_Ca_00000000_S207]